MCIEPCACVSAFEAMRNNSSCHLFNFMWNGSLHACNKSGDDTSRADAFLCRLHSLRTMLLLLLAMWLSKKRPGYQRRCLAQVMSCDKIPKLLNSRNIGGITAKKSARNAMTFTLSPVMCAGAHSEHCSQCVALYDETNGITPLSWRTPRNGI